MYDISSFAMADMTLCSRKLRSMGDNAESLEDVAQKAVKHLYDNMRDEKSGQRSFSLVRFFVTCSISELPPSLQDFSSKLLKGEPVPPDIKCLTLLGSAGSKEKWNSRFTSSKHKAIPLTSETFTENFPMISALISQFGMEIGDILKPSLDTMMLHEVKEYNIFHIEDVRGNLLVPSQKNFVIPENITSIVGFGGMLPSGRFFTVIIFSKAPIPKRIANMFRPLALSLRSALLHYEHRLFNGKDNANNSYPLPSEESALRNEVNNLKEVLLTTEEIVLKQSCELELRVQERTKQLLEAKQKIEDENAERKLVEEKLKKSHRELEEKIENLAESRKMALGLIEETKQAKELLENIISNIPYRIFWKDRNFTYLGCNNKFAEDAGLKSPKDILGKTDQDLPWEKSKSDFYAKYDRNVMERNEPVLGIDEPVLKADGTRSTILTSKVPLLNSERKVIGLLGIFTDITEIKRLEAFLKKQAYELRRSNHDLEQFAYLASHDLQEPLRMVSCYVGLLERNYRDKLGPDANEYIGYILDGTTRMRNLIDDLLLYSRATTQGKEFRKVNFNTVLKQVINNLQVTIRERGAVITSDILPVVKGCSTQLFQLMQNLLSNAIKFCDARRPEIQVTASMLGEKWLFRVRDNGIGIEEEFSEHIFEIFRRLHGQEKYPGTGVGLSLCKKIVENHEGEIWVEPGGGKGSTFNFTLPADPNAGGNDRRKY